VGVAALVAAALVRSARSGAGAGIGGGVLAAAGVAVAQARPGGAAVAWCAVVLVAGAVAGLAFGLRRGPAYRRIGDAAIGAGLAALTGEISQVPSAVSAIKVNGQRAYARVRAGEEVALAARQVTVSRLDLLAVRRPGDGMLDLDVDVACTSGTYVRALARDLGAALGVGGHLTALRRTFVGGFTLAEAVPLDELAERPDPVTLPLAAAAARFFPRRDATPEEARIVGHGGPLAAVGIAGPYAVFDPAGQVLAIVAERDGRARAQVVLASLAGAVGS